MTALPMPGGVFRLAGPDRRTVLNSLVTNDVKNMPTGGALMACLLTPKGKIISPMLVVERGEDFILLTPPATARALADGLAKYLAVSDSFLEDISGRTHAVFSEETSPGAFAVPPEFWGRPGWAALTPGPAPAAFPEGWEKRRVASGLPVFGVDAGDDVYPTELGWDFLLHETKGCYVGQETTARLRFKGQARRRLARLKLSGEAAPGTPLSWQGSEVGRLTSVSGGFGLSLLSRDAAEPGVILDAGAARAEVLP